MPPQEGLTGADFEYYVKGTLETFGYRVDTTATSNDYGADLVVTTETGKILCVQCKYYKKSVGVKAVQEVVAALPFYNASYGAVITNSTYSQLAKNLALQNNILLIDGTSFDDMKLLLADFLREKTPIKVCYNTSSDLTVKDLVGRYGINAQKVYKDCIGNGLPYRKVGREYRFDPYSVDRWEIEQKYIPIGHKGRFYLPAYKKRLALIRSQIKNANEFGEAEEAEAIYQEALQDGFTMFEIGIKYLPLKRRWIRNVLFLVMIVLFGIGIASFFII